MPSIIAENSSILVINKPSSLIVHSDGRTVEKSLADWILESYPQLRNVGDPWISPQGERVLIAGMVHRLDRTTSGAIIVAKSQEIYDFLKKEFKERRVEKSYRAFVYGSLQSENGQIVAEIMRSGQIPKRWYARPCKEFDKRAAITNWRLLDHAIEGNESASYVEARPITGRTHQLRVHFASVGHAIVGDHLYAVDKNSILGFERPALHAYSISILMPSGIKETYTAPLPVDFEKAMKFLVV